MKKFFTILMGLILLTFTGCTSSTPTVSINQRNEMRTKIIEADYNTTYKALMTTLENQGYTIDNTDMNTGLITASASRDTHSLWATALTGQTGVATFKISCNLTKLNAQNTRVRINAREESTTRQGLYTRDSAKEIDNVEIYNSLFNELRLEVARFKALN